MASFFRNTFDNWLSNLSSSLISATSGQSPRNSQRQPGGRPTAGSGPWIFNLGGNRATSGHPASATGRASSAHNNNNNNNTTNSSNNNNSCPFLGRPSHNPSSSSATRGANQQQSRHTAGRHQNMYNNTNNSNRQNPHQTHHNRHHSQQPPPSNAGGAYYGHSTAQQQRQQPHQPRNNIVEKCDIQDIPDLSDIKNLTARQLKTILTRNCVDYKGVFEKEVLQEKVSQLWIDHNARLEKRRARRQAAQERKSKSQLSDDDDIEESQLCKICMEQEIDCVLLECGHYLTCITCGKKLSECPICRQNVVRCVRTFRG